MRTDSEKLQAGIDKVFAWADKHGLMPCVQYAINVFATIAYKQDDWLITFAYNQHEWWLECEWLSKRNELGEFAYAKQYGFDDFLETGIDVEIKEIKKHLDYKKEQEDEEEQQNHRN